PEEGEPVRENSRCLRLSAEVTLCSSIRSRESLLVDFLVSGHHHGAIVAAFKLGPPARTELPTRELVIGEFENSCRVEFEVSWGAQSPCMTVIDHLVQSINIRTNNRLALRHGLQDDPGTAFCIGSHEQHISLTDDFSDLLVRYGSYEDYIV